MKTMRTQRVVLPLALLSAAFMLACQDQGLEPMGLDGIAPQFAKKTCEENPNQGSCKDGGGGGGGDGTKVTWSEADLVVHEVPDVNSTLRSTCPGTPGSKPSNPTVEWKDGTPDGAGNEACVTVTPKGSAVPLTNDASMIVATKKGSTEVTLQFSIQDVAGAEGIQYRTDRFVIDAGEEFTGAGFTLHVHSSVDVYRLKGHTGGPKVENVGTINIGDIVYR